MPDITARTGLPHLLVRVISLVLAVITIGAQLDREARFRPHLASLVPPPFRSFAQGAIVQKEIAQDSEPAIAYHEARQLLRRRPIAEENLTLFGVAAARAGDTIRSLQAFDLAAARGWHGEIPQYLALAAAAQAQQWTSASLRMRALMQIQASDAVVGNAVAQFSANDGGRSALALILSENPAFQYRIIVMAQSSLPPTEFDLLIGRLEQHRRHVDCDAVATLAARWLDRGIGHQSSFTWDHLCASDRSNASHDLRFASASSGNAPFAWKMLEQSGVSVDVDPGDGALNYTVRDGGSHRLAVRRMALSAGEQQFRIEGHPTDGGDYPLLRLRCVADGRSIRLMPTGESMDRRGAILPPDCPVQRLELIANKGGFAGLKLHHP